MSTLQSWGYRRRREQGEVSRRSDRVKVLTWSRGGFVLLYKRLETGAQVVHLDATQYSQHLLQCTASADVVWADETPLRVLDVKKTKLGFLWTFLTQNEAGERLIGYREEALARDADLVRTAAHRELRQQHSAPRPRATARLARIAGAESPAQESAGPGHFLRAEAEGGPHEWKRRRVAKLPDSVLQPSP